MQLLATSSLPNEVFYQQVEDKYLPMLQQIEGVAEITMTGGDQREIRINVNNDKLRFYGLSLLQVTQAINQANLDFPTGPAYYLMGAAVISLIDHLFNRLDGAYPGKWRQNFRNQQAIDNWAESWVEAFEEEGITPQDVKVGLRECRKRFGWPPSVAEFMQACRPALGVRGLEALVAGAPAEGRLRDCAQREARGRLHRTVPQGEDANRSSPCRPEQMLHPCPDRPRHKPASNRARRENH